MVSRSPQPGLYAQFGLPIFAVLSILLIALASNSTNNQVTYDRAIKPILATYCYSCHGNGVDIAELALDEYESIQDIEEDRETWMQVNDYLKNHVMPPAKKPQPSQAERDLITAWIERVLYHYDPANPDPGRVTMRRLNRHEYNNTIRDLIRIDFQPADDFPSDDTGYGFDNIGDVLSLPPVLFEKYLKAAEQIMDYAIVTEQTPSANKRFPVNLLDVGGNSGKGWARLTSFYESDVAIDVDVPYAADYVVRVLAYGNKDEASGGYEAGDESYSNRSDVADRPLRISIMLNRTLVREFEVTGDSTRPEIFEARFSAPQGEHQFRAVVRRFRGGEMEEIVDSGRIGAQQKGAVYVKYLEIEGPLPGHAIIHTAGKLVDSESVASIHDGELRLTPGGQTSVNAEIPVEGSYLLRATAYTGRAGHAPLQMQFSMDERDLAVFQVDAPGRGSLYENGKRRKVSVSALRPVPQIYEVATKLKAGKQRFSVTFLNSRAQTLRDESLETANLVLKDLQIVSLDDNWKPPVMPDSIATLFARHLARPKGFWLTRAIRGVLGMNPSASETARQIMSEFTRRAWRRPATDEELDRLMRLYEVAENEGEGFYGRMKLAMKGVLVSPHFIFRQELQPDPNDRDAVHPVGEFALATRLSYFLWSSMPDDVLFDLAEEGELRQSLEPQIARMLRSPKAKALVDNFAGQWLQTRKVDSIYPSDRRFRDFDGSLRTAMRSETERFFEYIMREDRSVLEFLDADYTFVNDRLAEHYGIPNVTGDHFRRISIAGLPRRGVLTHGSILSLTSNPTRTSPVKRGKWVLENLLGAPPPPPPPDVPELEDDGRQLTGTLRQQMVRHRENSICASCHARMDPIGFGLENFDGIGAWRDAENGHEIDPSGELTTGETFDGALGLIEILAENKRNDFLRCLSEKMLTYAIGRGLEPYDAPAIDSIVSELVQGDYRFSQLVTAIVSSYPFQMRRGEGDKYATVRQATDITLGDRIGLELIAKLWSEP
jgi:hypothetical protein